MQATKRAGSFPAWLWFLQIVTGLGLSLFIVIHVLDVSSSIFGVRAYEWVARTLETGFMSFVNFLVTWLVGLGLIIHAALGIKVASNPYQVPKESWGHAWGMKHRGTWFWLAQVVTGSLITIFASIHWFIIHFHDGGIVKSMWTAERMNSEWYLLLYLCFLVIILFHAVNGTRSALIKLGIMTSKVKEATLFRVLLISGAVLLVLGIIAAFAMRAFPVEGVL